jgi:dephospho-CoA kinase
VRDAVIDRFGQDVAPGGRIDRAAVARAAFSSPEGRGWLEELLWPRVGARMAQWRQDADRADPAPRAAVVEVPLLFESGMEAAFDATIAVVADEPVRSERAGARGHEALEERGARQLSQQEKAERATYVVENDGTVQQLEAKLSGLLEMLESRRRHPPPQPQSAPAAAPGSASSGVAAWPWRCWPGCWRSWPS